jgi:flagellar hook protein FlgE
MISASSSALSALQAFGTKIQSNANNIANANTDGYKKTRVTLAGKDPQGVHAQIEKSGTAGPTVQQEGNSGVETIELSNVDMGNEIPEMLLSSTYYKANLKTIQIENEMLGSLLRLKA